MIKFYSDDRDIVDTGVYLGKGLKMDKKGKEQYRCQLCGRQVHAKVALMHIKAEEYLIDLIKKDHPHYHKGSRFCDVCITYYRKLVKNAEI